MDCVCGCVCDGEQVSAATLLTVLSNIVNLTTTGKDRSVLCECFTILNG